MAIVNFNDVTVRGIAVAVPECVVENADNTCFPQDEVNEFISVTGIERFHVAGSECCTSDLSFAAAEKLIAELGWERNSIELLIFMSQTPDFVVPNTATIMQDRLQLSTSCAAFDMSLGCSGYLYGLSTASAYLSNGVFKRALLLCGDTLSKTVNPNDKTTAMLFGDAASATAIEYDVASNGLRFLLGTDGSGAEDIIIPNSGYRNPVSIDSFVDKKDSEGKTRNSRNIFMKGMDVFSFGINKAPFAVKEIRSYFDIDDTEIDFYVFHQANKMMNEMVRKKLKIGKEKVPYSLKNFGNTSSATIPLTLVSELRDKLISDSNTLLLCGFGVGLSWGACILDVNKIVVPEIVTVQ